MNKTEELSAKRHSLAHLLAAAVLELYPEAKPTLGPAIENGFYYDFEFPEAISEKDLPKIEKKMRAIASNWQNFTQKILTKEEALALFTQNPYKQELIEEITQAGEVITTYSAGDFTDLCKGGHIDDFRQIDLAGFKLDRLAGAYWRGDENNKMLTRIYGLAFENEVALNDFLNQRIEAEKRDHRKLGKELDLFTFSDLVGSGLPLFTPKGTFLRQAIVNKIKELQSRFGWEEVWIPHITKKDLYQTSGHWDKFGEELFQVRGQSQTEFILKPMNCPHHTQIYASQPRSYKDLPLRYAETTTVYRDEKPGELLGLTRVRSLTQDDGHVFCTPEQAPEEIENIIKIILDFYTFLGLLKDNNYWVSLSFRDPNTPDEYIGDPADWDRLEETLLSIAQKAKLNYKIIPGEAAFYGSKIDFMFQDALGRQWQLATVQLDLNMPVRFGLNYIDQDGSKKSPIMIHRAIAGSLERFLGVIIEHFAGAFPLWLAPIQVAILPVSKNQDQEALEIDQQLKEAGLRTDFLAGTDSLGKRIRKVKQLKYPYWLVIGDKEIVEQTITVENRQGEKQSMSIVEFIKLINDQSHAGN